MEHSNLRISNLLEDLTALLEKKKDLILLQIAEKVSIISSSVASGILVLFVSSFLVIFGGIALAWYIGERLESIPLGFAIIAAFFALLIAVMVIYGKKLIRVGFK